MPSGSESVRGSRQGLGELEGLFTVWESQRVQSRSEGVRGSSKGSEGIRGSSQGLRESEGPVRV